MSRILLKAAALAAMAVSVSAVGTICDRTVPTLASQHDAIQGIVVDAVTNLLKIDHQRPFFNGTLNYRYAADPYALPINSNSRLGSPNGQTPPPDYTIGGSAAQNTLVGKLTDFFGMALGCTAYTGAAGPWAKTGFNSDMEAIHRGMPISQTIMTEFITAVANAATKAGVSSDDVTTVGSLLTSFSRGSFTTSGDKPTNAGSGLDYAQNKAVQNLKGMSACVGDNAYNSKNLQCTAKVNMPSNATICQRYTAALFDYGNDAANQYQLVQAVVHLAIVGDGKTVDGLIKAGSVTKTFFDGTTDSRGNGGSVNNDHPAGTGAKSPDYTTNTAALLYLQDHLVKFFGSALGCTGFAFPSYDGVTSMYAVHKGMKIDATIFNAFNGQVAASASALGVSAADVKSVGTVLASFGRQTNSDGSLSATSICNQDGCPCADGYSGTTCTKTGSASSIQAFSFAAILSVLLAMIVRA